MSDFFEKTADFFFFFSALLSSNGQSLSFTYWKFGVCLDECYVSNGL